MQTPRSAWRRIRAIASRGQLGAGIAAVGLAVTLTITNLERGGFTGASQNVLLVCTALMLVALIVFAPATLGDGARRPAVGVLCVLGALALLSILWTTGPRSGAVREGCLDVALATIATAGFAVDREWGPMPLAVGLGALAMAEAVLGLGAAALRESPSALLINGSWRPSGTYEYPPALGLLQVMALPVAFAAVTRRARATVGLGVAMLALTGAVLGSADNRFDLALAVATLIFVAVYAPRRALSPHTVLTGALVLLAGVVAGALLLGRHVQGAGAAHGAVAIAGLVIVSGVLVVLWPLLLALGARVPLRALLAVAVAGAVAAAVAWVVLGDTSTLTSTGGGFGHGRISYWTAAFDAWKQRPWLGSGAGTFFAASAPFQAINDGTIFAHNLPLEVAVELGIPGFVLAVALYGVVAGVIARVVRVPGTWLLVPTVGCFLADNLVDWSWHLFGLTAVWAAAVGGLAAARVGARVRGPA